MSCLQLLELGGGFEKPVEADRSLGQGEETVEVDGGSRKREISVPASCS